MNSWKQIWNKKNVVEIKDNGSEFDTYCVLKKANGFDVAVGNESIYFKSFYSEWIFFYERVKDIFEGESINSIYEVGCGSGVNLFMFQNRENCEVGGCDYSAPMIESVKSVTSGSDFTCCAADGIDTETKYDIVMSESVFQYFESLEYAEIVLRKMLKKSKKLVYLGEIHNKEYEKELIDYRKKTIKDYENRYAGLGKLFFSKDWIENIAKDFGKTVVYTSINNPEYLNSRYEFNCYIF